MDVLLRRRLPWLLCAVAGIVGAAMVADVPATAQQYGDQAQSQQARDRDTDQTQSAQKQQDASRDQARRAQERDQPMQEREQGAYARDFDMAREGERGEFSQRRMMTRQEDTQEFFTDDWYQDDNSFEKWYG